MSAKLFLSALVLVLCARVMAASVGVLPPVNLAWNENPEPDVVGYEVKYGTVIGNYGTTVSTGLETSVSVSGLVEGVTYYFVLLAIDKDGLRSEPAELSYTGVIPQPNTAPECAISAPTSDVTITEGDVIYFAGSGSDPDGNTPLAYRWSFGSGSGIADSTEQNPGTRIFNLAGTYEVTLSAVDSLGLEDSTPAIRLITVIPRVVVDQTPESTIMRPSSDATISTGEYVSFSGSGSDLEDNFPFTYLWQFGDESGIEDSMSRRPGLRRFDRPGVHVVTFTVTNSLGLADPTPATRVITVVPPVVVNQAPESTISTPASDIEITVGGTLSFSGGGSDPDGNTPLTYHWDFGSESGFADSTSANPGIRRFNIAGVHVVTLTVSDSLGLADPTPAVRTVTVSQPNQAPDSTISEPSADVVISEGGVVYFAGDGSDPDENQPLTFSWDFGSGSGIAESNMKSPGTRIFREAGTYLVTFTAVDSRGLADQTPATRTIHVLPADPVVNEPPESIISSPSADVVIAAGESVFFSGSASDRDGNTPVAYSWTMVSESGADGSTDQEPGLVRFDQPGVYEVSLTVTDSAGLADPSPARRKITVNAGSNRAPFSMISSPPENVTITAGESVEFAGIGDDPDGNMPLTYHWRFSPGSGVADSMFQNPGRMQFDTPGTYQVSLTVSDSTGLADASPAQRTVTVLAAEASIPGLEGWITSPESDVMISAGESVWFTGSGINNYRWGSLSYRWNFGAGSGIPNSMKKRPEAVRFDNPGTYVVTFTVINPKGLADPSPDSITITVTDDARQAAMPVMAARAAAAAEVPPVVGRETIDGSSYLTFTVVEPTVDDNLTRIAEISSDLKTWHSGPEHMTVITDDQRTLKVRAKHPVGSAPCCFFRLKTAPKPTNPVRKP